MNRIRYYRGLAGMTQEEFAEKMDVTRATVVNWERGVISFQQMKRVAETLNVPLIDIYGTDILVVKPTSDMEVRDILRVLGQFAKDEDLKNDIHKLVWGEYGEEYDF